MLPLAKKVQAYLEDNHIYKTVAIMGCVVNGPGEAREADIGVAGGRGVGLLFSGDRLLRKVPEQEIIPALMEEIDKMLKERGGHLS